MATKTRRLADLLANIDDNSKVTSAGLLDATITAADLADDSVGVAEIIDDAVTAAAIADGAVVAAGIGTDAVTSAKIATGAVVEAKLGAGAVTETKMTASLIEVKPHIVPGVLHPSYVASGTSNKLADGITAHSGAFGTAQSDGRSYYYTNINGSKPIKDPRIGAHFGSQRHKFTSVQRLESESNAIVSSYNWYSLDGRAWARTTASNLENAAIGHQLSFTSGTDDTYEVTGYFSDINLLTNINDGTRTVKIELDGVQKHAALDIGGAVNSPYIAISRFVESCSCVNAGIGATALGIHTIKVTRVGGNTYHTGIELIAHDKFTDATCDTTNTNTTVTHDASTRMVAGMSVTGTGIAAGTTIASVTSTTAFVLSAAATATNANQTLTFGAVDISIPAQNVVSYGKKFAISASARHYNPFATNQLGAAVAIGATTSHGKVATGWAGTGAGYFDDTLDTATSLGLAVWVKGGDYWRPVNGGRIVKWIDSSGAIKTSVNMMPPTSTSLATAGGTNEPDARNWTTAFAPSFHSTTPDHSQAEVAKQYLFSEFGNGAANGGTGAPYADASMLNTDDNITFTMDDGSTSLSAKSWVNAGNYYNRSGQYSVLWFTFIGTGLTLHTLNKGKLNVAQNLPYGSHIFEIDIDSNADNGTWKIDGETIKTHNSGGGSNAIYNFNPHRYNDTWTIYQPKMPPIPENACILADYMLMADFVPITGNSPHVTQLCKGTRALGVGKDFWFDRFGGSSTMSLAVPSGGDRVFGFDAHGDQIKARLSMFATNYCQRGYHTEVRTKLYRDASTDLDGSATKSTDSTYASYAHLTADLALGVHNLGWNSHSTSTNGNSNRVEIASPIHSSSHYQTFETPFLHELVGGDRNMEQTNLVVTGDGKTWDEVTRDTSYIGNVVMTARYTGGDVGGDYVKWDDWRGNFYQSDMGNKDSIAIAYDRVIILKDGYYHISMFGSASANDGDIQMRLRLNGNTSNIQMVNADGQSGNLRPSANIEHSGFFKRGDYLQLLGHGFEGYDPYLNQFQIRKIN
jgi:hypothetical protein